LLPFFEYGILSNITSCIQVGGFICMPYLGANPASFCICSLLNGGGFTLVSEISKPTSIKSCSIPAGDSTIISFAISLVSFLKLCQTLGGLKIYRLSHLSVLVD
jgi:hypothetical protein